MFLQKDQNKWARVKENYHTKLGCIKAYENRSLLRNQEKIHGLGTSFENLMTILITLLFKVFP